jgi:anti-sigma factor RsiW
MNCRKARKQLLLDDAGDLPASEEAALRRHVATCAACRRYEASLADLRGQYAAEETAPATPSPTLQAILAAAREPSVGAALPLADHRRPLWQAAAWIAAAVLVPAAAAFVLWPRVQRESRPIADLSRLERRVALAVEQMEEQWSAFEGELAIATLEIHDWLTALEGPGAEKDSELRKEDIGS